MSVLCLGEVWLELNAATAPELTETFRAQTGGWGAGFCRQYAALGGQAALLAQLGADPFGRKLAARLARDGVDCSLLCFTDAFPTPVVFTGADTALPYRAHTAGLALRPEQLEAAPFRGASAFCFSSAGLVDSPLRLAHLEALAAARDAGALCCYLPRLAQAAPYWPQREALCQTALQFLDRADVLFLEESDLLLLFGSRELRTALFALFTGHVQLIFFYKKDRILAFTRSVMASAAKKDQSPALVLYRMEQMGIRNTQYIIARHHDTKHPHCHLVFNRIDNEGNLISDSNERIRNAKVCRALTKEYGFYFAPKNSKARNKSRLRPHQLRKYNLRSSVLDAQVNSRSWNDFISTLKGQGIDMRFNHAENSDKIRGISFCMDEFSIAGSKLDRDLSFNNLCTMLGDVAAELIIQPHQVITPGGGGGTNNEQGGRDDKDKDNQRSEPFYKPSKRRR